MDIKTLMLGDWVKYQCMPTQVEEIQSDGINGEWDGQECYGNLSASDLHPIKLTQELLEKNGWEFPSKYSKYMLHAEFHEFALFHENDDSFTIIGKGDIKCIQYVHDLQQTLRFFGNYDLANNFKIIKSFIRTEDLMFFADILPRDCPLSLKKMQKNLQRHSENF